MYNIAKADVIVGKGGEGMTITKRKVVLSVSLILLIVAVSVIVIAVLIHMGFGNPATNKAKNSSSLSTDSIVDTIIDELDYSGISRVSSENISRYYDFDEDLVSEATVYISDSADLFLEISCFKLNTENEYSRVEAQIKSHINSKNSSLQRLNPKESKKLDNTRIEYCAPYLLVVVADNSESAVVSFKNLITGKSNPTKN